MSDTAREIMNGLQTLFATAAKIGTDGERVKPVTVDTCASHDTFHAGLDVRYDYGDQKSEANVIEDLDKAMEELGWMKDEDGGNMAYRHFT